MQGFIHHTSHLLEKLMQEILIGSTRLAPILVMIAAGPVDRYYIENFLLKEAALIKGRCLEIGDNDYSLRYGKERVIQSDILHVNESNTKATIIGDLSDAPQIANNLFDCIVLTQTLHLIYDFKLHCPLAIVF